MVKQFQDSFLHIERSKCFQRSSQIFHRKNSNQTFSSSSSDFKVTSSPFTFFFFFLFFLLRAVRRQDAKFHVVARTPVEPERARARAQRPGLTVELEVHNSSRPVHLGALIEPNPCFLLSVKSNDSKALWRLKNISRPKKLQEIC